MLDPIHLLALTAAGLLVPGGRPPDGVGRLVLEPVEIASGSGTETVTVQRGTLRVPIVRADPDSKEISVDVWLFPAVEGADPDTPPLFQLHGGPGWPGLEPKQIDYAGDLLPLLRVADVVLVGQRGIGTSLPHTRCEGVPATEDGSERPREERAEALVAACKACREHWEAEGYDLTGLNVLEAAADVDDVRRSLGYDEITLWGGSFGSHWGMTVLRYYPETVARAVLHGMEGPDHTYDMPSGVLGALERMAAEAEQSTALEGHVPDGGLIAAFTRVIEDVEAEPLEIEIRVGDELRLVELDADDVRDMATGYTGSTSSRNGARTWAADVIALYDGDFEGAARSSVSDGSQGLPTASFFMLDCGSGISPERLAVMREDPAARIVGALERWYETACSAWDADLGEEFRSDFVSEVPTLVVHGTWDTNTPFENALELVPMFSNGHFVVVEGGSHGALGEAMAYSPEFRAAVLAFVATGDSADLPDAIDLPDLDWVAPRSR